MFVFSLSRLTLLNIDNVFDISSPSGGCASCYSAGPQPIPSFHPLSVPHLPQDERLRRYGPILASIIGWFIILSTP